MAVIRTNIAGRADLTVLAVECGAKAIVTEKPMTNTLEEADRMVHACAEAGVPLCGGAAMADHPSFARAKQLILDGAIGELLSIEAPAPSCQTQAWSYFVDDELAWAAGTGDAPRSETGSDEFHGDGLVVTRVGLPIHFRAGSFPTGLPGVRLSGSSGEISLVFGRDGSEGWRLFQDVPLDAQGTLTGDTTDGAPLTLHHHLTLLLSVLTWTEARVLAGPKRRVELPWPSPQLWAGWPSADAGLATYWSAAPQIHSLARAWSHLLCKDG